jgi:hypothetical protein
MNMTFIELYNIVKRRLGIPYTFFEISYEDFVNIVKDKTLRLISQYVPKRIYVPFKAKDARVEGTKGVYKIPYDGEIVSIIDLYVSNLDLAIGYPMPIMQTSIEESTNVVTDILQAIPNLLTSSIVYKTWEFLPPNMIKIFPAGFGFEVGVVYMEVLHEDLSSVPGTFAHDLIDLVLADVYDTLGDLRSKYQQVNSPFGDIQLNADTLISKAENLRSKVYERLVSLPPNTIVAGI